jgi:hypothetical protein
MADYERSATIDAGPAEAYTYLADASNMPKYISLMTVATPTGMGGLRVAAEVQGRHEEGDATFAADAGTRTLRWGSAGSDYNGWLSVAAGGSDDQSKVTIHLHTNGTADGPEIERTIDDSLANIKAGAGKM